MNAKILLAFIGGAALASGIVYMAVKPDPKPVTRTVYVDPAGSNKPSPAQADPAPALTSPVVSEVSPSRPEIRRQQVPVERRREISSQKAASKTVAAKPVEIAKASPPVPPAAAPVVIAPALPPPPAANPEPVAAAPAPPEPAKVDPPQPHSVTLIAGTPLLVRIGETLTTKRHKPGDTFIATLDRPLEVDGFVIAERGSRCEGRVTESDPGGRVKGVAEIGLELISIHTSDGQKVRVHTSSYVKEANSTRKKDAAKVGGGAALGAIIGAIAGGGKGAAIGTAAGGAAGAGDVMVTRGNPAEVTVETRVTFRVQEPVTITEKLE